MSRPVRPAAARLELVPAGPIDVKPDPWQRLVAIGSILSVLFVAVGLYITNEANRQTSGANREQQRLTEQGQITDRFGKAVEQLGQLGEEKVGVRLGAIYALERIMRDSAVDHPAVVNVLTAFIRINSPKTPSPKPTSPIGKPLPPPVDIQAALTVLGRRDATRDRDRLDLTGADLSGANLYEANLSGANLIDMNLQGANLYEANLQGANLQGTKLQDAILIYADLRDADLRVAKLHGAYLHGADLTCAQTDQYTQWPVEVARPAPCD